MAALAVPVCLAQAPSRAIPFWPDEVPAAIHARDRRQRGARDRAGARALPPRAGLARVRRGRRASAEEAPGCRPLRRRDRALSGRRQDALRPLRQLLRVDTGLRDPRGGLATRRARSRRFPSCRWLWPTTARTRTSPRSWSTSGRGVSDAELRRKGRPRADRARRRQPGRRPRGVLRRARGRGVPVGLSQPAFRLVGRRSGPRALGSPVSLSDRQPLRLHALQAPGAGVPRAPGFGREDRPARARPGEDGSGHLRRRRGDDSGDRSGRGRDRPDGAPLPRVGRRQRQRLRKRRDLRGGPRAPERDPEAGSPLPAAHDPFPVASGDRGLAGLPDPAPRGRGEARGRDPHGHGRRVALDDEGHAPRLALGGIASARRRARSPAPGSSRSSEASQRYAERGGDPREGFAWLAGFARAFARGPARRSRSAATTRCSRRRASACRWSTSTTTPT